MKNQKIKVMAAAVLAVFAVSGCAKSEKTNANDAYKRYFDAWMQVNRPDAKATDLGVYVLEDENVGDRFYEDAPYVYVQYTVSDLQGNITYTTEEQIAKQIGTYGKSYYYGPQVLVVAEGFVPVGVEEMLKGMTIGSTRTAAIPSWLMTTSRYKNGSEYFKHTTDNDNSIYKVTLLDTSTNIINSEIKAIEEYGEKYFGGLDSLDTGLYYKQLKEPTDTNAFKSDTTIYINYIGRLLNGQVFDTTIEDTAKFYNIYSSSSTYEPVKINWADKHSEITMGDDSGSLKSGFTLTLWHMRKYEKAVGVFTSSPYGYGYSGSGKRIPSFAPLSFEIEIVDDPKK